MSDYQRITEILKLLPEAELERIFDYLIELYFR